MVEQNECQDWFKADPEVSARNTKLFKMAASIQLVVFL